MVPRRLRTRRGANSSELQQGPAERNGAGGFGGHGLHKMLGVPALRTGLFYRNGSDAYAAFSQEAAYLYENEQEEWWNLSKRTLSAPNVC